jgi:hypothetical protein
MRIQTMAPLFAHSGLDDVISLWSEEQPKFWADIAKTKSTNQHYYRTASEGDLPQASPINEGRGITFQEYRTPFYKDWYPTKFGIGFAASTEAEETDFYGVIGKKATKMLVSMEWAREVDGADYINLATSTAFTGPDGKPLAASDHPIQGGTASNIITSNPALSYSALETAWQQALQTKTDAGNYMGYTGPFDLIVGASQVALAERLLGTDGIAGTFNKDVSTLKKRFGKVVYSPYITSTTAWAIRCADPKKHGLAIINRRMNVTKTQYDITKDANLYTLTAIWVKSIEDWRGFWYSSGLGA